MDRIDEQIDKLSEGGRLSFGEAEISEHDNRIKDIERGLSKKATKGPSRKRQVITQALNIVNQTAKDLKTHWDKQNSNNAVLRFKYEWDKEIKDAKAKGASDQELTKLTEKGGELESRLLSQLGQDLANVSGLYRDPAMKNIERYGDIARDEIQRTAAMNILRNKRKEANKIFEDIKKAVYDETINSEAFQSKLEDRIAGLDLPEQDEKLLREGIKQATNEGHLQQALFDMDEEGAMHWLGKTKDDMSADRYKAILSEIKQIPIRIDEKGKKIFKTGDIHSMNAFSIMFPKSTYSRVFDKNKAAFLSGKSKFNKPVVADLNEIAQKIVNDPKLSDKEKARRLLAARDSHSVFKKMVNEDPSGLYEVLDEEYKNYTPEQKANLSGRYTNNAERSLLFSSLHNSFKEGKLNSVLNALGNDRIMTGKIKEALAFGAGQIKPGDKKGQAFVSLLRARVEHGGALGLDDVAIRSYLDKTKLEDIPSFDQLEKMITDSESYNKLGEFFRNAPGGETAKKAWMLDAWVQAQNVPVEGKSEKEVQDARKAAFNDILEKKLNKQFENKEVIGNKGKWTAVKFEGTSSPIYLDNDLMTNPNASMHVTDFVNDINSKKILDQDIFDSRIIDRINASKDSKLKLVRRNDKLELWYSYEDSTGTQRWDVAVDHSGAKITTSEQYIAKYGRLAFRVAEGKEKRYKKQKPGSIALNNLQRGVKFDGRGRLDVRSKRQSDLKALAGVANSDDASTGINRFFGKGSKAGKGRNVKQQETELANVERRIKDALGEKGFFGLEALGAIKDPRVAQVLTLTFATKGKHILIEDELRSKFSLDSSVITRFNTMLQKKTQFFDRKLSGPFLEMVEAGSALGIIPKRLLELPVSVKMDMSQQELENYYKKVNAARERGEKLRNKTKDLGYDFSGSRFSVDELSSPDAIDNIR